MTESDAAPSPAEIDGGFEQIRAERFLARHLAEARDPDFWRAMNPQLTISTRPFAASGSPIPVEPAVVGRARQQILSEGYLQTPPLVRNDVADRLRIGIERVAAAGFPSVMACIYDEFYAVFQGLDGLFSPLLGPDYRMVLQGLWAYHVAPGDPGRSWTALQPHRDRFGPDPRVLARDTPSVITVWMPLTDVSTGHSCITILPAHCDEDYYSDARGLRREAVRLQDLRALPAAAGSILGWSSHLVHWGSRSSRFVKTPRISVAVYFQRRDLPPLHPFIIDFGDDVPVATRFQWIDTALGHVGLVG